MQNLRYLDKYEEDNTKITFHLKDYPSSKLIGNKLVSEYYEFFYHTIIDLDKIIQISELVYEINKD